jgi:hypothetical protein
MKMVQFFSRIPLFSQMPNWKLKASLIESYLFLPQLRQVRLDIFPRKEMAEDKYLEYIPFTWTGCNNLGTTQLATATLWDMMVISMLNYQADEYMEAVVGIQLQHNLTPIRALIVRICQTSEATRPLDVSRKPSHPTSKFNDQPSDLAMPTDDTILDRNASLGPADTEQVLAQFVNHVLTHPKVRCSPFAVQRQLRHELATFLLAHVEQIEDNARFARQQHRAVFASPTRTYFDWVRTTSADHTSCPYSFVFYTCLVGKPGQEIFATVSTKYLAQDLARHLATMCRQYNDYGSITRDHAERNLNSVNFPEFHGDGLGRAGVNGDKRNGAQVSVAQMDGSQSGGVQTNRAASNVEANCCDNGVAAVLERRAKKDLLWLAEYERECMRMAMRRLERRVGDSAMTALRLFVNVTDLYGQIYMSRDIASRMKTKSLL